jgi:alanine racemase
MNTRPTWAEISLSALRRNYRMLRDYFVDSHAEMMPVVKADAYGHGAIECAQALRQDGAGWFGVTCASEGLALRFAGIEGRIILLSGFFPGEERQLIEQQLTPAVWLEDHLYALEAAAENHSSRHLFKAMQSAASAKIPVHLKVDTGMCRLGVQIEALPKLLGCLRKLKHVELEGVFSHYASAEIIDSPQSLAQEERFAEALRLVQQQGFEIRYSHMANSSGLNRAHLVAQGRKTSKQIARKSLATSVSVSDVNAGTTLVRPGIALYGYRFPIATTTGNAAVVTGGPPRKLTPVLSWKTRVMQVKKVGAGEALGYNGTFVTSKPSLIAALPVGYADGLNRLLSNKGRVIVRGAYAPIVGRVSMDITLTDVTGIPGVSIGDEVILIGQSDRLRIDAWEHSYHCGTIPYEILCNISKRVPRVHLE